ncbi:MAG: 30S ribosomal protein S12 methylthiotransferase RimO [Candidatus Sumerlaeia bacterium]|nr:30S ribosomal protein S12 methylthiotransferase RimO [Candidatus Sumerlaeia bacterium]
MRIGMVTLGCDKNTVDNEYLAGLLGRDGHAVEVADPARPPDVVVITTCGFIQAARDQSLEAIAEWSRVRARSGTRLGVIGCLAQRSREDLLRRYPDIDFLAGVGEFHKVARLVAGEQRSRFLADTAPESATWNLGAQSPAANETIEFDDRAFSDDAPRVLVPEALPRTRLERRPHGFLKISDGCNHTCTFCSIPLMKGVYSSVPKAILLDEARRMLDEGIREINVVAQDITKYGFDIEKRFMLPELLDALASLSGEFWIRLFYLYPSTVTTDLIQVMQSHPKIARYLDIPLQHLDPAVLQRMRRPHDRARTMDMLRRIRAELPDCALRTTFIVGFPGETPDEFRTLMDSVREIRFERMGVFTYSREPGTPAADLPNQVTDKVKQRRREKLMKLQSGISAEWAAAQVGTERRVLVESAVPGKPWYVGRSHSEAADIDGVVRVHSETPLAVGDFVTVRITEADVYDLTGEALVPARVDTV